MDVYMDEAQPVASETALARSRDVGKDNPGTQIPPHTSRLVIGQKKHTSGSAVASPRPCSAFVYKHLKRRLGHTLRGFHCKRHVVRHRKLPPYKLSKLKGSVSGPLELRASLQGSDCVSGNGQHNCDVIHQEGWQYEIKLSVCPPLEGFCLGATPGE